MIFSVSLRQPGEPRIENGTLGTVTEATEPNRLTVETKGTQARKVQIDTEEVSELRLSYAKHVYKAQGRTVDQAFVLTGGWQTDRERAYVALTRARDRTDIYVSREDLGEQGMDAGAIERLGEAMSESHAQEPSIATEVGDERESEVATVILESQEHNSDPGLQID